jgi:hypothetical protein
VGEAVHSRYRHHFAGKETHVGAAGLLSKKKMSAGADLVDGGPSIYLAIIASRTEALGVVVSVG